MSSVRPHAPRVLWISVVIGGLLVALGDFIFATTLWFSWDAEGLKRVFQTIAVAVARHAGRRHEPGDGIVVEAVRDPHRVRQGARGGRRCIVGSRQF